MVVGFPVQWRARRKAAAILAWPKAPGVVVDAGRYTYTAGTSESSTEKTGFRIEYDYAVGGKSLHGKTTSAGGTLAELEARYVKGGPVEVQFDPQHPERSRVGFTGKGVTMAILPWALGAIMIVLGALMCSALS